MNERRAMDFGEIIPILVIAAVILLLVYLLR